ncbi:MAG: efflux RND transporter periplasmic adaptor subunit [Verrucomicrobia bacterium]|nr:efflux RND transporter periplasmic adaptor subunit [Verrucomicrobiota bacterium]
MNLPPLLQTALQRVRQRPVLFGVLAVIALVLVVTLVKRSGPPKPQYTYYPVKRSDFLISIVEGGTLEAVDEEIIRSEVEGVARIIFIVKEGSTVKKGDLLVELDSSSTQDAVSQQQINVEKAQFAVVQAEQQMEIQKSVVDSELAAAKLKVEFAQTDLTKYDEGEKDQLRRNAEIDITNVLESLQVALERLTWSERLYTNGFETKGNLDKDRLSVSQTKLKLEQATNALWMLQTFDAKKKRRTLEAALQEANDDFERQKMQGERKIAQAKADLETQKRTLELSQTKLERDKKQLLATKIYAPQDGLVVYAGGGDRRFSSESFIEEGATIRNRQEIIKLPDISSMKLNVKIHESHIVQVRPGQPAYVVLDSMPDQRFNGAVNRVAPLPDSSSRWGNPNLKVYATEIVVTDNLPNVKPGVSARAEVVITNLPNVLTVPIQAVTTRKGKQVVFLEGAPQRPVPVTVGMYNTRFIEIPSGLKEGDRVLLSPPFDTDEKDLGGAIIAKGDDLPAASTNQLNRPSARSRDFEDEGGGPGRARNGGRNGFADRATGDANSPTADGEGNRPRSPGEGRRQFGPPGGRGNTNWAAMMKEFDVNGDGQLDETERAAIRDKFGGGRRRSENPPPAPAGDATPK